MSATYQIIVDQQATKDFIDLWLPTLEFGECYYVSLFARNKYCKDIAHIAQDKQQLKGFTTTKERLYNELQQLEVKYGAYTLEDGSPIPQEALCVYITPNPRSYEKATKFAVPHLLNLVLEKYNGYNPHQEILSIIAGKKTKEGKNAVSRKLFYDFDFDNVTFDKLKELMGGVKINQNTISYLQTRGGYHVLVDLAKIEKQYEKTWYNTLVDINEILPIDKKGTDTIIPIPGCYQGGFVPKFVI